jgi:putative endonuclease
LGYALLPADDASGRVYTADVTSLQIGFDGEALARQELMRLGYMVLESNFRCQWGELDVVCVEGGDLVFVEVKTRQTTRYGNPIEAVTTGKLLRLRRAAEYYKLTHHGVPDSLRFDVVTVSGSRLSDVQIYRNVGS